MVNTVPLYTLNNGKFKNPVTNSISTIFKRDDNSITIKRNDGWLVTIHKNDVAWNMEVIKII